MTNGTFEQNQHIIELISAQIEGRLTITEQQELDAWLAADTKNKQLFDQLADNVFRAAIIDQWRPEAAEHSLERVKARMHRKSFGWLRITAAASIILAVSAGGYFILHKQTAQQTAQNQNHDIAPGSNKAILKMANGKTLVITDAKNGLLAQQGSTTITKTADGKLAYSNSGTNNRIMLYDTLIVPRGGQHQVKFSDGSVAYVNADSKLRIPENFDKSDRTVELISGEADFQVIHNAKVPFRVKVKGQITEDIGTEFNINAYPEESTIKTTLLTGSVKVTNKGRSSILKPGQQAVVSPTSNEINIYAVDTDEAFAWKNGKFHFSNDKLSEIMLQASRWYDVDVVYNNEKLKNKTFGVIGNRFANASDLLHNLELTGEVKFRITNKKITVLQP